MGETLNEKNTLGGGTAGKSCNTHEIVALQLDKQKKFEVEHSEWIVFAKFG